jgi:hypothetical protein
MVTERASERGVALVFALATLTLVAITVAAVAAEIRSRGAGVVLEERSVRVTALVDAAMAESLAEIADKGSSFRGISERAVEGGSISSTVRAMGEWEVELVAVGTRDDWQTTIRARVNLTTGPRVLWWEKTQGPAVPPTPSPEE